MLKQDVGLSGLEFITDLSPSESERVTGGGSWAYKVKTGDTLSEIAREYCRGYGYKSLAAYNDLPDADRIYTGQTIKLPSKNCSNPNKQVWSP